MLVPHPFWPLCVPVPFGIPHRFSRTASTFACILSSLRVTARFFTFSCPSYASMRHRGLSAPNISPFLEACRLPSSPFPFFFFPAVRIDRLTCLVSFLFALALRLGRHLTKSSVAPTAAPRAPVRCVQPLAPRTFPVVPSCPEIATARNKGPQVWLDGWIRCLGLASPSCPCRCGHGCRCCPPPCCHFRTFRSSSTVPSSLLSTQ